VTVPTDWRSRAPELGAGAFSVCGVANGDMLALSVAVDNPAVDRGCCDSDAGIKPVACSAVVTGSCVGTGVGAALASVAAKSADVAGNPDWASRTGVVSCRKIGKG